MQEQAATSPRQTAIARGLLLFLGSFLLLNVWGDRVHPNFGANLWLFDLRILPEALTAGVLLLSAVSFLVYSLGIGGRLFGQVTSISFWILFAVAFMNTVSFYVLLFREALSTSVPIPFSMLICVALLFIWKRLFRAPAGTPPKLLLTLGTVIACAIALPVLQVVCFGQTDYRRPAQAIVVFGARAYADGRPSDALADRVRTACALYHEGFAPKLIFSGGPGDGLVHETEAMRNLAQSLGVRGEDIELDKAGLSTQATVMNTSELFRRENLQRVLAVSHFYHLPRIKMTYQRAGTEVFTVPAKESYFLSQTPFSVAREVPAMWFYYLRPLWN